jgi:hypothetical protein
VKQIKIINFNIRKVALLGITVLGLILVATTPSIPSLIWLGILGFLLGILLFWNHPGFGLILIIITLPIYFYASINISGLNIRIYNAISLVLMAVLILKSSWRFSLTIPVLVYLLALGASVFVSMDKLLSLKYILFQVFGFILMWVTYNLVTSEKAFEKYIYLLLLVGNIDTVLIIINTLAYVLHLPTFAPITFTDVLPIGRPNLFLGEPDRTAEYHLVLLLMCIPLVLLSKRWKGKYYLTHRFILVSFLLNLYIIIIGLFRSAWIGVVVALLAFVLISIGHRRAHFGVLRMVPLVIICILLAGALLLVYPPFSTALFARVNEAVGMILHPRLDVQTDFSVIYVFFQRALQRPWLGWGIGYDEVAINPAEVFTYHLATVSEGFNRLVRMFFGGGVVALAGFVFWQVAYMLRLIKGRGDFAYRMALLLPVIGVYWGHDMIRMVSILPTAFLVMGLGLALHRITPVAQSSPPFESYNQPS